MIYHLFFVYLYYKIMIMNTIQDFDSSYEEFSLEKTKPVEFGYIYYLFYKDVLVYIGQTVNLSNRISTHINTKFFDKVLYKKVAVEDMKDIERQEIRKYFPIYNCDCITKADHSNPNCKVLIEYDDFYIVRYLGHVKKTDCYLKDNILLLPGYIWDRKLFTTRTDSSYLTMYFIDIVNNTIRKEKNKYIKGTCKELVYCPEEHYMILKQDEVKSWTSISYPKYMKK